MTNTENTLDPSALLYQSAQRELASAQRAYEGHLERLRTSPEPWMLMRVLRVRYTTELARTFVEEGLARTVEVATAWRALILNGAQDATGQVAVLAQAKSAQSWLYNHETDITDVLAGRLGSDEDRESIISDLISGG